jgi:hypothetical protein
MTITKRPNGIEIYTISKGYLVSEFYIGYTIKEAKRRFIEQHGRGDE